MELGDAIKKRYSERDYSDKIPDREQIMRILESAREAPNSCNMQVMHFLIIDDQSIRQEMSNLSTKKFNWAPVNVILMVDSRITVKRHSAIMSLGAAMQNMLLTATDMGLAACPMAGFSGDKKIREKMKIPTHYDLILIIGIGYPVDPLHKPPRERIALDESVHWNFFDNKKGIANISSNLNEWSVKDLVDYRRRIAPVYRYYNHFSLNTFSIDLYEALVARIKTVIDFDSEVQSVLDVNTYDGVFVKSLVKETSKETRITIADTLDYILSVDADFGRKVSKVKIGLDGSFVTDEKFDFVTCIHKLQFTPNRYLLLKNSANLVKEKGYYVLAFDMQSPLLWLFRKIILRVRGLIFNQRFNVYENNPYYKIGPYKSVSKSVTLGVMKRLGFTKIAEGIILSHKHSNRTYYVIFRKG